MFRAVVFDLDGTLYKGEKAIDGAGEALDRLREQGLAIFFLSNAGTNKRKDIAKKLQGLGIRAAEQEIYSSCYGAGRYILEKYGAKTRFYAVAEKSAIEEMQSFNLVYDEKNPKVVVVSLDRYVTYEKIARAYRLIKKGAEFIATNKDPEYPVEDGTMPGAGAIVASVESAVGKKPVLIGKPSTMMLDWLLKDHKLKRSEVVLVGDSIKTDLAVAKKARIRSILVLSGLANAEEARRAGASAVIRSVRDLPKILWNLYERAAVL